MAEGKGFSMLLNLWRKLDATDSAWRRAGQGWDKAREDVAHMGSVPAEPKASDYPHGTFSTPAAKAVMDAIHAFNLTYHASRSPLGIAGEDDRRSAMVTWLQGARHVISAGAVTEPLMREAMVKAFSAAINSFGGE